MMLHFIILILLIEERSQICDKTPTCGPGPKLDFRANSPAHLGILPPEQAVDDSMMNGV